MLRQARRDRACQKPQNASTHEEAALKAWCQPQPSLGGRTEAILPSRTAHFGSFCCFDSKLFSGPVVQAPALDLPPDFGKRGIRQKLWEAAPRAAVPSACRTWLNVRRLGRSFVAAHVNALGPAVVNQQAGHQPMSRRPDRLTNRSERSGAQHAGAVCPNPTVQHPHSQSLQAGPETPDVFNNGAKSNQWLARWNADRQ